MIIDCEQEIKEGNFLGTGTEAERDYIGSSGKAGDENWMRSLLDEIGLWIKARYVSRNKAVAYLNQVLHTIYKSVRRQMNRFCLQETVLSKVAEARGLSTALETDYGV